MGFSREKGGWLKSDRFLLSTFRLDTRPDGRRKEWKSREFDRVTGNSREGILLHGWDGMAWERNCEKDQDKRRNVGNSNLRQSLIHYKDMGSGYGVTRTAAFARRGISAGVPASTLPTADHRTASCFRGNLTLMLSVLGLFLRERGWGNYYRAKHSGRKGKERTQRQGAKLNTRHGVVDGTGVGLSARSRFELQLN